ncbi:hypothetical protein ACCAA_300064 [Candidatus Accumulibacter aalborgensis]|uniref:Uncharacterized protein n=1 Tax=Candidatus Accumulibacter aalborgensis TaxID=1860102 RepID=A0A1A8XM47_9PROT|nr:hypothetical protein ACCAA_300064 [Candidatus Accumulibacter aalborgensis]
MHPTDSRVNRFEAYSKDSTSRFPSAVAALSNGFRVLRPPLAKV